MPKTNFLSKSILDHITGVAAYAAPAAIYIGLSSTTPAAAGTGATEPSTGAYARVQLTGKMAAAALDGSLMTASNSTEVVFPESTAAWLSGADLTHAVIYDAATAGNMLRYSTLTTPRKVEGAGVTIRFPISAIDLTES